MTVIASSPLAAYTTRHGQNSITNTLLFTGISLCKVDNYGSKGTYKPFRMQCSINTTSSHLGKTAEDTKLDIIDGSVEIDSPCCDRGDKIVLGAHARFMTLPQT